MATGPFPTPRPTPVKGPQGTDSRSEITESQASNGDSDDETLFVSQSKDLSDPFGSTGESQEADEATEDDQESQIEKVREANIQHIKNNPPM